MIESTKKNTYTLYGGLRELYDTIFESDEIPEEVMVEGAAGTGKSFAISVILAGLCEMYPGIRVLMSRKTRVSMTQTIMVTFEKFALPRGHSALHYGGKRSHRSSYEFPNGSEIVLYGFDDPERIKSSEYDIVYVNEATEISVEDWEIALSRLRNNMLPIGQFAICDCNPSSPSHWLNNRANMKRIKTAHEDNPALVEPKTLKYTDYGQKYMNKLDRLTGVRYKRLRLGEWCAAEGAIWPNFRTDYHVINGEMTYRKASGRWNLFVPMHPASGAMMNVELTWFIAGVDWGYRNPGCILVLGMDKDGAAYVVEEIYHAEKNINWWAEQAEKLRRKYDILRFVCDEADADAIDVFNTRMTLQDGSPIAVGTEKRKMGFESSFSVVRERMDEDRLFFLADRQPIIDERLQEDKKSISVVDEIPSYEYREHKEGQPILEMPRPDGVDHGCDALRYGCWFIDNKDWTPDDYESPENYMLWKNILNHDDVPIVNGFYVSDQWRQR